MVAAALLATPLATVVPVGGDVVVQADQAFYDKMNQKFATEGIKVPNTNQTLTVEKVIQEMAKIIYSTEKQEIAIAVNEFRTDYSDAFHAIFGADVTVDDFLKIFLAVEDHLIAKTEQEIIDGITAAGGYKAYFREVLVHVVENDQSGDLVSFKNDVIKENTGLTYDKIFAMLDRLDNVLNIKDTEDSTPRSDIKLALINAVKLAKAENRDRTGNTVEDFASLIASVYEGLDEDERQLFREHKTKLQSVNWRYIVTGNTGEDTGGVGGGIVAPSVPAGTLDASTAISGNNLNLSTFTNLIQNATSVNVVRLNATSGVLNIPVKAFQVVSEKNKNAKVEITSPNGTIRIPVSVIKVADIAAKLGVDADNVEITVSITPSNVTVQNAKSPVIEFKITAKAGEQTLSLDRFDSYVERDITASEDVNVDRATVVRLNADGTVDRAVPTIFDGKKSTFKSMSNSLYTVVENEVTFPDVTTNYWAKDTIEKLASKLIIEGMPNGTFAPTKATTRAELAALLTRSIGLNSAEYDDRFKDVRGNEWYVNTMMAAVEAGIIEGHADGTFKANDPVTREQAAAMIARAMNFVSYDESKLDNSKRVSGFGDANKIAPWAKDDVETLVQAGLMEGRPNAQFAPKDGAQRAETTALLERFLTFVKFMN